MKKILTLLLSVIFCSFFSSGILADSFSFQDVNENNDYNDFITLLTEYDLMEGRTDVIFAPDSNITRAEFISVLANIGGEDLTQYHGETPFLDVDSNVWYAPQIEWAYKTGLINGLTETVFGPENGITKEEAALLIVRMAATLPEYTFPEINDEVAFVDSGDISPWAAEAISTLQKGDIYNGDGNGYIYPKRYLKRGEAAKVLGMYYYYQEGYKTHLYVLEHQDELDAEIEAAQNEMAEIESNPIAANNYFGNTNILHNAVSPQGFVGGGFQFLDGDILYTNGTFQFGHIGMACGNGILEIIKSGVQRVSYSNWASRYSSNTLYTYVLRRIPSYCGGDTNCRNVSISAAWYGQTYFLSGAGRNYTWSLSPDLSSTTKINCSGLAYKCYRDGAGFIYKIKDITTNFEYATPVKINPNHILECRVYNGFSAIHKFQERFL